MSFQVYVSFMGRDVRQNFFSHLYAALDQAGVSVYKDDEDIEKGKQAENDVAIVIFSMNYASSRYCLSELARLMELRVQKDLIVLPVFYHVEPADVSLKTRLYNDRMCCHDQNEVVRETVERWKKALSEAGMLRGWKLDERMPEATVVKEIVEKISELKKFDVFLSFRGKDVRENFINNLNKALVEKGINTFMDSESLMMGQDFPPALKDAIEQSRMYIVVFSKNYAESWWCLKELVQILERSKGKQLMLPIFYQVKPGEVREQKQNYDKEWGKHEIEFGKRKVNKWRMALTEAANMQGRHLPDGIEDDWIPRIVEDVEKMMAKIKPKPK